MAVDNRAFALVWDGTARKIQGETVQTYYHFDQIRVARGFLVDRSHQARHKNARIRRQGFNCAIYRGGVDERLVRLNVYNNIGLQAGRGLRESVGPA